MNQIMKIVLKFVIALLNNFIDWFDVMLKLLKLQRIINNNIVNTKYIFNKIVYDFNFVQSNFVFHYDIINVSFFDIRVVRKFIWSKMFDVIALKQMYVKFIYDKKHKSIFMKTNNWIFFRLYKKYNIFSIKIIKKKLFQQYVDFFQIIEKIDYFVYRLTIFENWRVHFVFIIV